MSYPAHDTVSPNDTGRINSPAPQYTNQPYLNGNANQQYANDTAGIEHAPAQHHTEPPYSEKAHAPNTDPQPIGAQNGMPPQQQNFQQDHFQQDKAQNQNGINPQQYPQQNGRPNQYQTATPVGSLQQSPAPIDCPICGVREMTRTEFVSGGTTHLSAILCCVCLCLGCIPYLASWFKDCEHHCGNCGGIVAVWHRSGHTEVLAHRRA